MKNIALIYLLLTSMAFAAEVAPEDTSEDDLAPQRATADEQKQRAVEHAKRVAERGARASERAAKEAQRRLDMAKSKIGELEDFGEVWEQNAFLDGDFNVAVAGPTRTASPPLVVRTRELEAAAASNLQEDLAVMSRILYKTLGRDGRDSAMGIVLSAVPGSRRPQSMYLEGYGALFFMNVRFPLAPAPVEKEEVGDTASDSDWEQTKRELFGQKNAHVRIFAHPPEQGPEYDADRVDQLKKELLEALKNANNIRALQSDESVTVVVLGNRGAGFGLQDKQVKSVIAAGGRKLDVLTTGESRRESTMTIRAKKADIDAYARGTIDITEFGKRAAVAIY